MSTITTTELARRLDDPGLTIVDVRPLAAYNGWRLEGEQRGGHIPGARSFPAAWLRSVDEAEIARHGLLQRQKVDGEVVYGELELIDHLIPGDDLLGLLFVALEQSHHRRAHQLFRNPRHGHEPRLQQLHLFMKMTRAHPNRPVM